MAVEAVYGWKIDSLALLADAGHNLSDVIGLVLAWGGALAGRLRPDLRHTYGWQRASILASWCGCLSRGPVAWAQSHLKVRGLTRILNHKNQEPQVRFSLSRSRGAPNMKQSTKLKYSEA